MSSLLRQVERFHFIGIGGIGMCGLAEILKLQGYAITGSDLVEGKTVERLRNLGISVSVGHRASQIGQAQAVVTSSAIPHDNPEIQAALRKGLFITPRAELLAELIADQKGVAVAGTHGKTTTASLIWHILRSSGLDPSAVIGGRLLLSDGKRTGAHLGRDPVIIIEADESDGSFLQFAPDVSVITNVEAEHIDFYGDEAALRKAFVQFANQLPKDGICVLCLDDPAARTMAKSIRKHIITYGLSGRADVTCRHITAERGLTRFQVHYQGEFLSDIEVPLLGNHNVLNTLAALSVSIGFRIPPEVAKEALRDFPGVERRFETKGTSSGITIVDDYAHHPTEICATLNAARQMHSGRLVAIFQPHRFTRMRDYLNEFAQSLKKADVLLVSDVYPAGEAKIPGIDSEALCQAVRKTGHKEVFNVGCIDTALGVVMKSVRKGDLVITIGAGSVTDLGPQLLDALGQSDQ